MVASITELHLKNLWSFFVFLPHAVRSKNQASTADGIISIEVRSAGLLVQRTLTVWRSEADMKKYVKTDPHRKAMSSFARYAKPSYVCHFEVEKPPSWEDALERLRKDGRIVYYQAAQR